VISAAVFLTSHSMRILVRCMRRVLRIGVAFEPTRCSEDQLALVYEQVVPTVRRALGRRDDPPTLKQRAARQRKVAP